MRPGLLPAAAAARPAIELASLPELGRPHPARPVPPETGVLSAAVTTPCSGPCPSRSARDCGASSAGSASSTSATAARTPTSASSPPAAGSPLTWVGGAWAYHQHHPSPDPPVQHLDDIIRNAAIFHRRWGWWPMTGWLREFERRGLIVFDARTQTWQAVSTGAAT